jgi:hypothetical protein
MEQAVSRRLSDPGRFGQETYEARRLHILETLPVDLRDHVLPDDRQDDHAPVADWERFDAWRLDGTR